MRAAPALVPEDDTIQPARLGSNIAALSILQLTNYAVPLATVPYLVRVLGPGNFGLLSFAQAVVIYFDLLTDYGSLLSATRDVAVHRHDSLALARIFWRTAAARVVLALGSAVVLAALVLAVPSFNAVASLYAAAFLTVIGTTVFPVWFFQGIEQMKYPTAAHASIRLLTIPALFLLVHTPAQYWRAAAIQGSVPVLAGLLVAPVAWNRLHRTFHRPRVSEVAGVLRAGWSAFVANSALTVNATATITVLGLVGGPAQVGYYSAADKVIRALSSLLNPLTQSLYPHLNRMRARSLTETMRLRRASYLWIGLPALAVSLAAFLLARPVGLALWGERFLPSIVVLRSLAVLPLLLALINLIGVQTLLVFDRDTLVSRTVFAGALTNVVFTVWFGTRFGALGAAAANVISASLIVLGLSHSAQRVVRS